jgi:hypothetical protein
MDADSSFNLDIRIVGDNCRSEWYGLSKVVDADATNFSVLVKGVVDTCPHGYGDLVKVFYFCVDSKVNIPMLSDQDVVEMFDKHKASKCCYITFAYHRPGTEPPPIPDWDLGSTSHSVQPPITPSMPSRSIPEPSQETEPTSSDPECLANPDPCNEHVGVDEEGLYIDLGPQHSQQIKAQSQGGSKQSVDESSEPEDTDDDDAINDEFVSDDTNDDDADYEVDEIVKDREPENMPDVDYNKKGPPMAVGTVYSDIASFKLALATHAVRNEFHYNIEKSDTGRYRAYCSDYKEGCPWRIHASTMKDAVTVKVNIIPATNLSLIWCFWCINIVSFVFCRSRGTHFLMKNVRARRGLVLVLVPHSFGYVNKLLIG